MERGNIVAGRYRIESIAGQGGVGTVFKAWDLQVGGPVALKVLRGAAEVDQARFAREAKALSLLEHPALVRYLAHGAGEDGTPYLVMEWLEGEDLRSLLGRRGVTLSETIALGRRVADVLAFLHASGLLHRDVKPGNLFLPGSRPAEVKLLDLGLVTGGREMRSLTNTGFTMGTPGYMAPEQARGEKDVDGRADLFSLGCVLYRCVTGRPPFEGTHMVEVMAKLLLDEPEDPAALRPSAPAELTSLIRRLIAKEAKDRPRSAAEVAAALRAVAWADELSEPQMPVASARMTSLTAGERRLASVILVGPAEGAESTEGAEGAADALAPLVASFGAAVERLSGDVRIVHLTGADSPSADAARAARCALAIRAALPRAAIAFATGRSELTGSAPVGDAIQRAAAMLVDENRDMRGAAARERPLPSWIGVDHVTASLLGGAFDVREADGRLRLHGTAGASGSVRTVLGKEIPMLGRDWEMSALLGIFHASVEEEAARAALVTGPAGAGKSRLARELRAALRRERPDVEIWHARADALAEGSPLALLASAIRDGLGLGGGAPIAEQQRLLIEAVRRRLPADAAEATSEMLLELLDLPLAGPPSPALRAARADARIRAQRTREAWEQLLTATCASHPLVILLEDLHWGDVPTTRFVDDALSRHASSPWMVVAFGRPEVSLTFPDLWQERGCQVFRLRPLSRKAAEQMIRHVLGASVPAEAVQRIVAHADGNAFYVEELIRAYAAGGAADDSATLPETVLAIVQARIAHLDGETRRALRAASILGEVFWPSAVEVLLGREGSWSASGWVDSLVAQELLMRRSGSRFGDEPEVAFRHALLRDGAYAMLTEADRALGHRLAGEWLERKGEPDPLVLAKHFDQGGEPAKAVRWYVEAAERAPRSLDLSAAAERAQKARALDGGGAHRLRIHQILGEIALWRSSWKELAAHAAELIQGSPPGSEPWVRGLHMQQNAASGMREVGLMMQTIAALTSAEPWPEARAAAIHAHAGAVFILCLGLQLGAARGLLARAEGLVAATAERHLVPQGWVCLGHGCVQGWGEGDPFAAARSLEAAVALFDEAGDRQSLGFALALLAMFRCDLGAFTAARSDLERIDPEVEADTLVAITRDDQRAAVALALGDLDRVRAEAAARIAALSSSRPMKRVRAGEAHHWLGEIALAQGDLDEAERCLAQASAALRGTHVTWSAAALALARVHQRRGKLKEALACADEVLAMVEARHAEGLGGLAARLVKAEILIASGDEGAGRDLLARCRERLLAIAARAGDAGVRASYLRDVPANRRILELTGGDPFAA
jgi:tetratricopeptide (TPR) repeat protein